MKIVQNKVTDYLSINVTEDETPWSASSIYDYADEVRDGNYIYKYAGESETNTISAPHIVWESDKDIYSVWVQIRATNYFSALDDKTSTQTVSNGDMIIELTNTDFDTVSLLNIFCNSVTIELLSTSDQSIIYTKTYSLVGKQNIIDEKTYWYTPFDFKTSVYEPNIPLFLFTKIRITLEAIGGVAKLGRLIAGQSIYVGKTLYPATLDQVTYSSFNTDIFGNTELKQGQSVKQQAYNVIVPNSKIPYLEERRKELTAIALLFIMDESEDSILDNLLIYGYFTSAPFNMTNASKTRISVNIKGLI